MIALLSGPRLRTCLLIPVVFHFTAACPVLCSGNGQYSRGRCLCYSGWKGTECDVPTTQCVDPQCGGHGICIMGSCACNSGYKGENCEEGNRARVCGRLCLPSKDMIFAVLTLRLFTCLLVKGTFDFHTYGCSILLTF